MKRTLLFILITIFIANELYAKDKDPEFVKIQNQELVKFNKNNIELKLEVVIYNPRRIKAKLKSGTIEVFVRDKLLGTITDVEPVKLRKKANTSIPIYFNGKTGRAIASAFTQGGKLFFGGRLKAHLNGEIKVRALFIPLKINIMEDIKFKLSDINSKKEIAE